ncbi:MAG: hypothetical protein L0K86_04995 [Actinomycetia bacterium]|nr:hypothetical protein [Actinomycetes bacterium]
MAEGRKGFSGMKKRVSAGLRGDGREQELIEGLRKRVVALEREVQENRELNRRVAELTDVVTELLVPLADRDTDKVNAVLEKYREEL